MRALAILLLPIGCASVLPDADVRYTGRIVPEAACGAEAPATLVVRHGRFIFTPTDGVLMIAGDVAADGSLAGQLTMPGVDRKPFTMAVRARISGQEISGSYATPRCRFRVALTLR